MDNGGVTLEMAMPTPRTRQPLFDLSPFRLDDYMYDKPTLHALLLETGDAVDFGDATMLDGERGHVRAHKRLLSCSRSGPFTVKSKPLSSGTPLRCAVLKG